MSSTPTPVTEEQYKHHPSYFFLATEVGHLIVENWTGDELIDFIIVIAGAASLSLLWQGLGRLSRIWHRRLGHYAKLESQLMVRRHLRHRAGERLDRLESPTKRSAYLYHNGHVFHQSANYMELLEAHQERQQHLNTSMEAQIQRQKQRNDSLLQGTGGGASTSGLAIGDGEEDVFLDPNATQDTTTSLEEAEQRTPSGDRRRGSPSKKPKHERNLSLDMDPNRWNSLQRPRKGYIRNHSRTGLKCYRLLFHFLMSVNTTLKFAIGYVLMLVVMTFNVWFFFAVVGGATLGFFLFSTDLQTAASRSEGALVNRRIQRRQMENVRPSSIIVY